MCPSLPATSCYRIWYQTGRFCFIQGLTESLPKSTEKLLRALLFTWLFPAPILLRPSELCSSWCTTSRGGVSVRWLKVCLGLLSLFPHTLASSCPPHLQSAIPCLHPCRGSQGSCWVSIPQHSCEIPAGRSWRALHPATSLTAP